MKYKIEVHALGYEDHIKIVEASSLRAAKQQERQAKVEWCDHNAIDLDTDFEMPFTRVSKITESPPKDEITTRTCPDCGRPNQFGELCFHCRRERHDLGMAPEIDEVND